MEKEKRRFLPVVEDFYDYKQSIYLVIFAVYFITDVLVSTLSSNPMGLTFRIQPPMFLVVLFLFRKLLLNDIKIFGKHLKRYIPLVLGGFVGYFVLTIVGSNISYWILGDATLPNSEAADIAFAQAPFLGFFMIVIVGPILEELMYRRAIRVIVKSKLLYYTLSALLFGLAHIMIGFIFPTSLALIFTHALGGLLLAIVYEKTNNIWCSICIHMLNNGLGACMMLASL